jgi:stage II sporulation protein D
VFDWRKEKEIEPLAGGVCGFCADAKWYSWSTRLAPEDIAKAFKKELGGQGVTEVRVKSRTKSGRAREVAVTRSDGTEVLVGAPDFRAGLGYDKFRSTKFEVRREGNVFLFEGNGWGHGVGLCQEGAIGMAKAGKTYEQILKRYYPGATIEKK